MATQYAVGSDGLVALPTGYNATLNSWSATVSRTTHVTTGYGAVVHNRRASGVVDITGSAGGFVHYWNGASGSEGGFAPIKHVSGDTDLDDRAGGTITLTIAEGCTLAFGAVFSSYAFGVTQDGDSTVTFNFEMNDSDGPTLSWDETA